MQPRALIINPWIYDFAAFDLWSRPLGLLYISAALKRSGWMVRMIDCLDRLRPDSGAPPLRPRMSPGTGPWLRTPVETPRVLAGAPRRFCRYGLPPEAFLRDLAAGPRPDVVLIGSGMTYWYPGVFEAVRAVRRVLPGTPVVLGGCYAALCPEHARRLSGADAVVDGPAETGLGPALEGLGLPGVAPFQAPQNGLRPDLDHYPRLEAAPLMTSRGCPHRCPYCASGRLHRGYTRRDPEDVLDEIEERRLGRGVRDFAFFDDALLIDAEDHIMVIMEEVVRRGLDLRFHAPNGLHVGVISRKLAALLRRAGLTTVRLGLETLSAARREQIGGKALPEDFARAAANLQAAGFRPADIGVYILWGLPGQPLEEVAPAARAVREIGARPYLAEYSPLPGTPLFEQARAASPFDLAAEPLCHNNTLFPCRGPDFSFQRVREIKRAALGR